MYHPDSFMNSFAASCFWNETSYPVHVNFIPTIPNHKDFVCSILLTFGTLSVLLEN